MEGKLANSKEKEKSVQTRVKQIGPRLKMKQGLCSRGGGRVRKRRAEFKYKGAQTAGSCFYGHRVIFHKTLYILIVLVVTQYETQLSTQVYFMIHKRYLTMRILKEGTSLAMAYPFLGQSQNVKLRCSFVS